MFAARNSMRDFRLAGFGAFAGNGRVDIEVVRNAMLFYHGAPPAPTGLQPAVDSDGQAGVMIQGNVGGTLRGNLILGPLDWHGSGSGTHSLFSGIYVAQDPAATHLPLTIRGNRVRRVAYGLAIQGGSGVKVIDNAVTRTWVGLGLDQTVNSRVAGNVLDGLDAAIRVGSSSAGNRFTTNHAARGGCVDESAGLGTGLTANRWVGNTGPGSTPEGLCAQP